MRHTVGGLVAALLLVAMPGGLAQECDAPSCLVGAPFGVLERQLQPLVGQTDELARIADDEQASPKTVYVATRPSARHPIRFQRSPASQRLNRRVGQARPELGCPVARIPIQNRATMNPKTLSLLHAEMYRANALERVEREEYYVYLQSRGKADESFEEHMAKYASLARLGAPAGNALLQTLQGRSAVPLPESLLEFYRTVGGFHGGNRLQGLVIHDGETLAAKCAPNTQEAWDCLRSMGLVDMILWSWGNDRFEFKSESGDGLNAAEIATLNSNYSIAGWRPVEEGEGFQYLYFDRDGRFGILHYHQDAFDELHAESLQPMLQQSQAALTFDEAIVTLLASAARSDWDDDD